MAAVTSAILLAGLATQGALAAGLTASLGTAFLTAGLAGGAAGYFGAKELTGGKDYLGDLIPGSTKGNDMPDAPAPPPAIDVESEGIRKAGMRTNARTEQLQKLYATRGTRAEDATLGGYRQTLGQEDIMGGGGSAPKPAPPPAQVSYKKEVSSEAVKRGDNRKALGSMYLQRRTGTPSAGGFGGQKSTLG